MKFMTTRWRMMLAKIKSANALSGEIPLKSEQLAGLLCTRRQTVTKSITPLHKRNCFMGDQSFSYLLEGKTKKLVDMI